MTPIEREVEALKLEIASVKLHQTNTNQVLSRLGQQLEELSASVVRLRLTMATAIGAATILMPLFTALLPRVMAKVWP